MTVLYHILSMHGYAAIIEFIIDVGDHMVTHVIAVVMLKAGVLHVGWKVVKRVRKVKEVIKAPD